MKIHEVYEHFRENKRLESRRIALDNIQILASFNLVVYNEIPDIPKMLNRPTKSEQKRKIN